MRMVTRCSTVMVVPAESFLPDVGHRLQHETARGADIDLGQRRLDCTTALSRSGLFWPRGTLSRAIDKLSSALRAMPQATPREADLVAGAGAHAIERATLAALRSNSRVIEWSARTRSLQRELVAGGAAKADRVPDVGPLHVFGTHQHGSFLPLTIGVEPGRAVGLVDRAMGAEPGRMAAARGKGPHARDPVAAVALDLFALHWGRAPASTARGSFGEDRMRHRQVEIGRRLAQPPAWLRHHVVDASLAMVSIT